MPQAFFCADFTEGKEKIIYILDISERIRFLSHLLSVQRFLLRTRERIFGDRIDPDFSRTETSVTDVERVSREKLLLSRFSFPVT